MLYRALRVRETPFLKVEGRRDATVIPFEKVQDTLRTELEKQEAKRLYDNWMTSLRQKAFIKKY